MDRPNIVLIMADQFAHDVVGALGHPVAHTPSIDRLVRGGVTFTNACCNSPLCAPSRASFVTGRLPAGLGVYDNGAELPASVPTLFHHLRRSGYQTTLSGKMHFVGPDQHHGLEHRLLRDIHASGFDLTPDWSRGCYPNPGTSVARLVDAGPTDWNVPLAYDEKVHFRALEKIRELVRSPANGRDPFFLCVSYMHPHDPFEIPQHYWDLYEGSDIPMPTAPGEPFDELHPFNRWIQTHHEADRYELTDTQIRRNRRAYYGMVSYVDDKIGEVVAELERMKMLDDTVVIVTADHGEMLGEHGMWFKRTFYEHSLKVPLIVWGPSRVGSDQRRDEVVSLVDLTATIMDLACVRDVESWTAQLDGESFAPLLNGEASWWRNETVFEYCGEGALRPMVGVRDGTFKYVKVGGEQSLLYDLERDPLELTNVANSDEYSKVAERMESRLSRYNLAELEERVRRSQENRLLIIEPLAGTERHSWRPRITGLARDW